jgi:hypothetical protein
LGVAWTPWTLGPWTPWTPLGSPLWVGRLERLEGLGGLGGVCVWYVQRHPPHRSMMHLFIWKRWGLMGEGVMVGKIKIK